MFKKPEYIEDIIISAIGIGAMLIMLYYALTIS